jgi:osmotically-inducible protein OsmY
MFMGFAQRTNPPIHIIVERGNVTLTGAVRSQVEKRQAESIVRSTFGVFQVTNRLTVNP